MILKDQFTTVAQYVLRNGNTATDTYNDWSPEGAPSGVEPVPSSSTERSMSLGGLTVTARAAGNNESNAETALSVWFKKDGNPRYATLGTLSWRNPQQVQYGTDDGGTTYLEKEEMFGRIYDDVLAKFQI